MAEAYDVQAIEEKWQARWRDDGHLRGRQRRPAAAVLRPLHVPVPERAGAHGPRAQLHLRRPDRPLPHDARATRVLSPDGLRQLRPARRERRHQDRRCTRGRSPTRASRSCTGSHPAHRRGLRLAPRGHAATTPSYIRWTQWIFLRFLEAGLAYRKNAPVNWCPGCQTVLANEQVLADGTCERSGDVVEKRDLEQWFFKITDYADAAARRPRRPRLARAGQDHAAQLDRPVRGRRVRAAGRRATTGAGASDVFTTRPDTSFGMTYVVLAPEHPLVAEITTDEHRADGRGVRRARAQRDREIERLSTEGAARQARRVHRRLRRQPVQPAAGADLPRRLRADGLRHRGDHGRARRGPARLGLRQGATTCPIVRTVAAARRLGGRGVHRRRPAHQQRVARRARQGRGHARGHRLAGGAGHRRAQGQLPAARLAALAAALLGLPDPGRLLPRPRQPCPCPTTSCPVLRPTTSSSARPASRRCSLHEGFLHTTCPECGGPAARETDTMDTFVDSSWYFLRFCDPWNDDVAVRSRTRPSTGCRSTSTSAASSTPSST